MDPTSLIPTPDTIPAPWWVFDVLGGVTLVLHLLLMNFILGGTLWAAWRQLRGAAEDADTGDGAVPNGPGSGVGAGLDKLIPVAFALTINLGVAPLLFVQVTWGPFVYVSTILLGVFWILVIPALIVAYYSAYGRHYARSRALRRWLTPLTALLLLAIAFVYTNMTTLAERPSAWVAAAAPGSSRDGLLLNLGDPTLWARYAHMVLSALAIAPLFASLVATWRARRAGADAPDHRANLRAFAYVTIAQVIVGLWFLFAIPRDVRPVFLGGDLLGTVSLWLGALSGVGAIATALKGKLRPTVIQVLVTIVLMVVARAALRAAALAPYYSPTRLDVSPQWGALALFLGTFVAGLGLVAWMVKVFQGSFSGEGHGAGKGAGQDGTARAAATAGGDA